MQTQTDQEINNIAEHIEQLVEDKCSVCRSVLQSIEMLSDETEKNILLLKYIYGKTWEEISEDLSYSLRQVYYLHKHALEHLEIHK